MKKIEVPLYVEKMKKGRPVRYDYSEFLKPATKYIILQGCDEKNYSSIRSTLTRWKKINNVTGKFEYDFLLNGSVVVWRV